MGAGHGYAQASSGRAHRGRLTAVLVITASVLVLEIVGGLLTGSLALLADAGHMFTDVAGIGLALLAITVADRMFAARSTFGFYRLEIFAAAVNAVLLLGVAVWVVVSAVRRLSEPPEVESGLMLAVAVVGLAANLVGLILLRTGSRESLNLRGAYLEVLGDLLGSLAVIVAAVVIALTGEAAADPLASIAIALLIVPRTWSLLREATEVLLEATPKGVDLDHIRDHVRSVDGVVDVHDLHVWTITSGMPVLSAHVVVSDEALAAAGPGPVLDQLALCLSAHFDVDHCTFQIEPAEHARHEGSVHP
ncbi:MAG: cation diffusion facilitator family transporter [Propionibacteriales bacterium]|nr:cation diffusion facilitator family transporter [Propionibacteriales bacterium]